MDLEQLADAQKYTIESIGESYSYDRYISLNLVVIDEAERVRKHVLVDVLPEDLHGFLGSGSIDDLPGKKLVESVELNAIYDNNNQVEIRGFPRSYGSYPVKGFFNTFEEEKEFRRKYGASNVHAWGDSTKGVRGDGIDTDIFEIICLLNKLPFAYTHNMSCSGSWKDHGAYMKCHNKVGIDERTHQGYITFRADTSDERFASLKRELESIGVEVNPLSRKRDDAHEYQKQKSVRSMAIQARVPGEVLDASHPEHETYLTKKWQKVLEVVRKYI